MTVNVRLGQSEDVAALVDHILAAGDGLFEHLFNGLLPGLGARDAVRFAVVDDEATLSWSNALIAELDGAVAGVVLAYPSDQYGLPPVVEGLVPRRRLDPLRDLFASRIENTLYINTVSVSAAARGLGLARLLIDVARDMAEGQGLNGLSLHAWGDNDAAIRLYESMGFHRVGEIHIPVTKHLKHEAPMLLMHAPAQPTEKD